MLLYAEVFKNWIFGIWNLEPTVNRKLLNVSRVNRVFCPTSPAWFRRAVVILAHKFQVRIPLYLSLCILIYHCAGTPVQCSAMLFRKSLYYWVKQACKIPSEDNINHGLIAICPLLSWTALSSYLSFRRPPILEINQKHEIKRSTSTSRCSTGCIEGNCKYSQEKIKCSVKWTSCNHEINCKAN